MQDRDVGVNLFKKVYCGDIPEPPKKGQDQFYDFMLDTLFGKLWADETMSIREKRLLLLGAIMAQGEEMTFSIHARAALKRGEVSGEQLEFMVLFLSQYVGYPKATKMRMALASLLSEFNKVS